MFKRMRHVLSQLSEAVGMMYNMMEDVEVVIIEAKEVIAELKTLREEMKNEKNDTA